MSLYEKKRHRREINLVPLIDVLVMLVFFAFVTMQFKTATTLNITLPTITSAGKNEFKGNVTIGIDKSGNISFNGQRAEKAQLAGLLAAIQRVNKDIPVLIKADEDTPLKDVTFVMDACRNSGLSKFSLESKN